MIKHISKVKIVAKYTGEKATSKQGLLDVFSCDRKYKQDKLLVNTDKCPTLLEEGKYYEIQGKLVNYQNTSLGNILCIGVDANQISKVETPEILTNFDNAESMFLHNNTVALSGVLTKTVDKETTSGVKIREYYINVADVTENEFIGITKVVAIKFGVSSDNSNVPQYEPGDNINFVGRLQSRDYISKQGDPRTAFEITIQEFAIGEEHLQDIVNKYYLLPTYAE